MLILHHKVVQIISQVVCTSCTTVAVKNSKEADLRPLDIQVCLALWLENVEDDGDAILVVLTNDALVCVGCVRFYHTALFLRCFGWLMILQDDKLGVQNGWILSEEQGLHLDELDVWICRLVLGSWRQPVDLALLAILSIW